MPDDPRPAVGLLGGTFDPPHVGHLIVAEDARVSLGLHEVRFLVAGDPWMKERTTPAAHRVAMVEHAVADNAHLSVDARETRRDGPTYTADTLEQLHEEEPDRDWVFLLGADAAAHVPEWNRAEDALARARFVALTRPGYSLDLDSPMLRQIERLDVPHIDLSSTDLRARFGAGRAVRYQVPRSVERYIREHGLYGAAHE